MRQWLVRAMEIAGYGTEVHQSVANGDPTPEVVAKVLLFAAVILAAIFCILKQKARRAKLAAAKSNQEGTNLASAEFR